MTNASRILAAGGAAVDASLHCPEYASLVQECDRISGIAAA